MPVRVVNDRSLVLLLSFLRVYNFETLSDYLHRCFRIVNNCSDPSDTSKMCVHACTSHCMKSARTDLQTFLQVDNVTFNYHFLYSTRVPVSDVLIACLF